jgi:hypothetical protein
MKRFPFVQRLRDMPHSAPAGADHRAPFRLWMTGSVAVVMAALLPMRDVIESEREGAMRLLRHSRYGVAETVQRIEAAAREAGLSVLARVIGARPVLVLSASVGGTPVVMDGPDSRPAVPLSVMVCEGRGGGADVLVAAASAADAPRAWQELPASVADDLAALPALVDLALS